MKYAMSASYVLHSRHASACVWCKRPSGVRYHVPASARPMCDSCTHQLHQSWRSRMACPHTLLFFAARVHVHMPRPRCSTGNLTARKKVLDDTQALQAFQSTGTQQYWIFEFVQFTCVHLSRSSTWNMVLHMQQRLCALCMTLPPQHT